MKFIQMSLLASTIVLFTACGSIEDLVESFDDDDDYNQASYTGQFVDTYVKGLNYTCTGWVNGEENQLTGSGVTNIKGEFTCNEGDVVEFSIGNYVIGSTYAYGDKTIKSPYDLGLGGTEAVTNVAQLLQTIDDKSNEGVLTIPDNFAALNDVTVTVLDPDFDALMADTLNVDALVSEDDAKAHLDGTIASLAPAPAGDETELMLLLAGKTVYIPYFDANAVAIWEFSADGTKVAVTEDRTWTESISFDGNIISVDNGDGTFTTIEATTIGTSSIDFTFTDGTKIEYLNAYFVKADAEAALNF